MDKKYLLITSDDFAISNSVNQGIVQGFQRGLLQSSNFMAAAPWLPEAVRLTKQHQLPIGVHLTLTCEWTNMSCGPITGAKSLSNDLGYFYSSYEELLNTLDIEDAKKEYRAQIQRVINSGVTPTHVETHMLPELLFDGAEAYQPLATAVEEVAQEFGLIYTYAVQDGRLKYFDDSFTMTHLELDEIVKRLSDYEAGIYHIICHCALDNEEQRALSLPSESVYRWGSQCRQNDLDIVTSERFKTYLEENGFELITIQDLLALHKLPSD
ncbi:ChbG/HpnK family deacetylase [uncultured Vibrio sp.]|uniref:carbohydrate deacetylase n=1 Tax=uncultured Vibrio sp. TaxID=114054 RepID=UPI0025E2FC48|nr:ChbG/HpnK family deacetylase [uncultured Vibrio sp.]